MGGYRVWTSKHQEWGTPTHKPVERRLRPQFQIRSSFGCSALLNRKSIRLGGKLGLPLTVHGDELERTSDSLWDLILVERGQVFVVYIRLQEGRDANTILLLRYFWDMSHGVIELLQALDRNCLVTRLINRDAGNRVREECGCIGGERNLVIYVGFRLPVQESRAHCLPASEGCCGLD